MVSPKYYILISVNGNILYVVRNTIRQIGAGASSLLDQAPPCSFVVRPSAPFELKTVQHLYMERGVELRVGWIASAPSIAE